MKFILPDGKEIEISLLKFIWVPIVIVLAALVLSSVYQVDTEEEGVILRFGRHVDTVGPGLHFKLPYPVDQVYRVPTQIVDVQEFGFRSNRGHHPAFDEESSMLTGDLNIVRASWAVQFTRVEPSDFLFNVKDPVDTLRDISQSVMREVMGDRASIPILTVGRAEIQRRARDLIQEQVDQFEMGIFINRVDLTTVDPPSRVVDSFRDLNRAEQDRQRFFEEASRQFEERVPRAQGQAERMVLEAEGFAERRVNIARGEAQRFVDTLEAYELAPEVTRRRLFLETFEQYIPELKEVIVVDRNVQGLLPHLNIRED
ncbi:MAG: FtsH protease activity modulator HflK [Opitutales bacterium]|nr:FtsH protease activity modulator HflK [Opitutales bacterium]MCH8541533.1 FtsH protease activity modulator HflK [Opitutales bacterium]